jgi:dienelactone hydrolase
VKLFENFASKPTLRAAIALLICGFFSVAAFAALQQRVIEVPVQVKDTYGKAVSGNLHVATLHDDSIVRDKPVAIINHGRSFKPEIRAEVNPQQSYSRNARWFAQMGYFVVMPTRIGYGKTGGEDVEDTGSCNKKNYQPAYEAAARQVLAVLSAVRKIPGVSQDRAVILGQSLGGATAVASASMNPEGVQAYINFAGGGGGNPETQPQRPCGTAMLELMFSNFGKTAKQPVLWVYTENDQWMGPKFPKEWFDAFVKSGGKGQFVLYPPHGADGHGLFISGPEIWRPNALTFLETAGLPTKKILQRDNETMLIQELLNAEFRQAYQPTGFAAITDVQALPNATDNCRKRYEDWLKQPAPKGFALALDGGCGFSWGVKPPNPNLPTDPAERAVMACSKAGERLCRLYALDDQVVWSVP